MAVSETAKLIVDLSLKGNFARQMTASTKALDKFARGESRAFKAGAQIGTGIRNAGKIAAVGIAALTSQVALGLDSLIQLEKAEAQTAAVLKSTGGAAKINAAEVTRLAEKYESLNAIVGDEFIRAGENMLLTFTNIRGKAFEPTLKAILDMNTAMGRGPEGLTGTAIQVGKALNDPTRGITALRKAGVAFTEAQIKKIKSLQKEGKLYEAQKIVLAELNKEFGGSFAKQGGTTAGKVAKFGDAIEDLQRTLAAGLLPVVSNLADALSELLGDPQIQAGVKSFGEDLGKLLSPAKIKAAISDLRDLAGVIGPAFKTAAGAIGAVAAAFGKLPPDLRNLLIGAFAVNKLTGGLVTNVAGGLASAIGSALKTIVAGNVTVIGKNVTGGGAGAGGKGGVVTGLIGITAATLAIEEAVRAGIEYGAKNTALGDKGLNAAEIAAIKYYQSSIAEQQLAAKRLGYVPTKADYDSAMAKLTKVVKPAVMNPRGVHPETRQWRYENRNKSQNIAQREAYKPAVIATNRVTTAVEKMRGGLSKDLGNIYESAMDAKIVAAAQARTAGEAKQSMDAGLIATGLAAKRAGDTSASATRLSVGSAASRITSAIRANRPITNVSVNVNATTVTKSYTTVTRYGPTGGSGSTNSRYGSVPT